MRIGMGMLMSNEPDFMIHGVFEYVRTGFLDYNNHHWNVDCLCFNSADCISGKPDPEKGDG